MGMFGKALNNNLDRIDTNTYDEESSHIYNIVDRTMYGMNAEFAPLALTWLLVHQYLECTRGAMSWDLVFQASLGTYNIVFHITTTNMSTTDFYCLYIGTQNISISTA